MGNELDKLQANQNAYSSINYNADPSMQNSESIQPPEIMNSQESNFAQNEEIMNSYTPKENIGSSNVLDNIKEVGETKILLQNSEINPPINEPVYNSTEYFLNNQEMSNQNINNESSSLQNTNLDDFIQKSTEKVRFAALDF